MFWCEIHCVPCSPSRRALMLALRNLMRTLWRTITAHDCESANMFPDFLQITRHDTLYTGSYIHCQARNKKVISFSVSLCIVYIIWWLLFSFSCYVLHFSRDSVDRRELVHLTGHIMIWHSRTVSSTSHIPYEIIWNLMHTLDDSCQRFLILSRAAGGPSDSFNPSSLAITNLNTSVYPCSMIYLNLPNLRLDLYKKIWSQKRVSSTIHWISNWAKIT